AAGFLPLLAGSSRLDSPRLTVPDLSPLLPSGERRLRLVLKSLLRGPLSGLAACPGVRGVAPTTFYPWGPAAGPSTPYRVRPRRPSRRPGRAHPSNERWPRGTPGGTAAALPGLALSAAAAAARFCPLGGARGPPLVPRLTPPRRPS